MSLEALKEAVIKGKSKDAKAATTAALDAGARPQDVVDAALVPAMGVVGERFKNGEIFVPEMLVAARAMKESMNILEPRLLAAGIKPKYTAVLGTVEGDLHDIGKNLVGVLWKGANFHVVDLGVNVPADKFVAAVAEHKPQLVGLSALLTTTMPAMRDAVKAIRAAHPGAKIIVGGAPITQVFADEIGADGYAQDAGSGVEKALELVGAA